MQSHLNVSFRRTSAEEGTSLKLCNGVCVWEGWKGRMRWDGMSAQNPAPVCNRTNTELLSPCTLF